MRKIITIILLILVMCPTKVYAEDEATEESTPSSTFNCGNDGQPKDNAAACYKDSGLVSSFANVEYVDCAVPYAITVKELGGTYSTDLLQCHEWFTTMSASAMGGVYDFKSSLSYGYGSSNVGDIGNWEGDYSSVVLNNCNADLKALYPNLAIQREDGSGANYVEVNGIRYYMAAIGRYFWNCEALGEGYDWLEEARGSIFDVILTDGQVFHFIMADAIATEHCVRDGGKISFYKCVSTNHEDCRQTAQVCTTTFSSMIKPYYKGIIHATGAQLLELWYGSTSQGYSDGTVSNQPIMKYMSENNAHIAYIRRYNLTIADLDKVQLNIGVPKGASWHMIYSANSSQAQALNYIGNVLAVRAGYSEEKINSLVRLAESNLTGQIAKVHTDNLQGDELTSIYNWETLVRILAQLVGY